MRAFWEPSRSFKESIESFFKTFWKLSDNLRAFRELLKRCIKFLGDLDMYPSPRTCTVYGGEFGIFPNPAASTKGKSLKFLQVPPGHLPEYDVMGGACSDFPIWVPREFLRAFKEFCGSRWRPSRKIFGRTLKAFRVFECFPGASQKLLENELNFLELLGNSKSFLEALVSISEDLEMFPSPWSRIMGRTQNFFKSYSLSIGGEFKM